MRWMIRSAHNHGAQNNPTGDSPSWPPYEDRFPSHVLTVKCPLLAGIELLGTPQNQQQARPAGHAHAGIPSFSFFRVLRVFLPCTASQVG